MAIAKPQFPPVTKSSLAFFFIFKAMKPIICLLLIPVLALTVLSCGEKTGHEHTENSPNQALYEEVMGIHDEVMPRMNDLYRAKTSLQAKLESPGLPEAEQLEIRNKIALVDSASEGMMSWMRQFDPIPDSLGEDKARAYLEAELVKVKKVREDILNALETVAK